MSSWTQKWKVAGKSINSVKKTVRKMAKGIGMTATNIKGTKTSLRSGGTPVYNVSAKLRERKSVGRKRRK